jgi:putative PIN family toxin of toxin-antitoxin system
MLRAVFDTNVVLSALLFRTGRLAWLRGHWAGSQVVALVSQATAQELIEVLAYPKFQLSPDEIHAMLADYLPYTMVIEPGPRMKAPKCRDEDDQPFVDLAVAGAADILVTGDQDLLALGKQAPFAIETPDEYRKRFAA